MRFFVADRRAGSKRGSNLALAIALATGSMVVSGVMAEPAYAAKKAKAEYSKEFIATYKPIEEAMKKASADPAALKAMIPNLLAVTSSDDEKMIAGNTIFSIGTKTSDYATQLQGVNLMLESGKVPADQTGRYNFAAYQFANALKRNEEARAHLQKAIDANFSSDAVTPAAMQVAMAESLIADKQIDQGLHSILAAVAAQKASGQPVEEEWYRRGLSVAYNSGNPMVYDFAANWLGDFPSRANWRDAINIARNLNTFEPGEMLDLLRLGFALDTLDNKQEYIDYIEAADARRLPKEVAAVIEQGYSSGRVSKDDIFVADSLKIASGRIATDRADLPSLENDARAPNAALKTVTAAGDTFLSYGQNAKAVEFYQKALTMPGADTQTILTRLGIAQIRLGNLAEAEANLAKVSGKRAAIGTLWSTYAKQKATEAETIDDAAEAAEELTVQ